MGSRSAPGFGAGWRRLTTLRRAWWRMVRRHGRPPMISSVRSRGRHGRLGSRPRRSSVRLCTGLCRRRGTRPGPQAQPVGGVPDVGMWAVGGAYVAAGGDRPRRHRDSPVAAASRAHSACVLQSPPRRCPGGSRTCEVHPAWHFANLNLQVDGLPFAVGAVQLRDSLVVALSGLAPQARLTLTWDQGSEMAHHHLLVEHFREGIFFVHPASPWQRGTNENTNGLLRQYSPKGTDLLTHSLDTLRAVESRLDDRPRKTLGWRTPAELMGGLVTPSSGHRCDGRSNPPPSAPAQFQASSTPRVL